MQGHSRRHKRWRRFSHKYGPVFFLAMVVGALLLLVGLLMYALTSPHYRMRW